MTSETNERVDTDAVVIREARASDLDAVLALLRENALPDTGVSDSFGSFLVATHDERVVGSCGLERCGSDALLRSVVVAAEVRRSGIGRELVEAALLRARQQRFDGVYLLTTTAREYFEALGFERALRDEAPDAIRDSWEFSNGCPSTATFMKSRLQSERSRE